MTGLKTVIRKELKCFFGSDKSTFWIHAIMPVIWSFALYHGIAAGDTAGRVAGVWLVTFAVIVTANFANTVFISERVNGALEILITSGLSRDAVLFGKMAFIIAMTSAVGQICAVLVVVWAFTLTFLGGGDLSVVYFGCLPPDVDGGVWLPMIIRAYDIPVYLSSAFFCASASAYLSVRMPNPRFLHFINLFMVGALMAVYSMIEDIFWHVDWLPLILALVFLLLGAVFTLLARREFSGERIIRPIVF